MVKEINLAVWDEIHINIINADAALITAKFRYSYEVAKMEGKMRTNSCIVIIVLFISTLSAFPSLAATILVPTDQPTIQACLDSAEAGDDCIVQGGPGYTPSEEGRSSGNA